MPIFALGFAIAIVCAVHAYRTGQDRFWIFVLLIAPGVGSLLYVILVVFPQWQAQHGSRTRTLSPKEMLAKAQRDVEHDVRGLAPDAGQGLERLALARHQAAMALDER